MKNRDFDFWIFITILLLLALGSWFSEFYYAKVEILI